MTQDTTPTSGAADLPDAMHMAELLENPINVVCQKTAAAVLRHQHSEFERIQALAAGRATAAQAVVPADLITLRKPTTSAELLWLLKLAHLVISDVGKTLEETLAPAQPAAEASRFGSPELQAMIIARCLEKDRADSVQEDAAWMPLTPELLTAIESGDLGNRFWIAAHNNNEPQIGVYEWRQGRNPHGFKSDLSRYGASEITHVLPYKPPALPAASKQGASHDR